jgi:hypothetical protein
MKKNLINIQNVLTQQENIIMLEHFTNNKFSQWFDGKYEIFKHDRLPLKKILDMVNKYFDLSSMTGVECWSHINTHPGWHVDSDDIHKSKTNEIKTPICSIVYYAKIENIIGGDLITETERYTPKTNDVITFSKGLPHMVEPFTGQRIIIAINPWEYKIEKYKLNKTLF